MRSCARLLEALCGLLLGVTLALTAAPSADAEGARGISRQKSHGCIIEAASCDQKDVQKAIDAAREGYTVLVPAGTATWRPAGRSTPSVRISNKLITLQGAGTDKTIIADGSTFEWTSLALSIGGEKPVRVTGLTFNGAEAPGAAAITVSGGCRGWRIDHCKFDYNGRGSAVYSYGDSFGLIDNCEFVKLYTAINVKGLGAASWRKPLGLGTADAVYVEDCKFTDCYPDGVLDGYDGARYVLRYNTATRSSTGHHGCDSGGYRSTFSFEMYGNRFEGEHRRPWFAYLRGGTGVIFNNTLSGFGQAVSVNNFRSDPKLGSTLCGHWGVCDGSNPNDGNEEPDGYPSLDQIGRSTNQLLEPVYEWDNTLNKRDADIGVNLGRQHIKEDRDFYNDTRRPGYKPFPYPHPLRGQWPPAPTAARPPAAPKKLVARILSERQVGLSWKAGADRKDASLRRQSRHSGGARGYHVWLNGEKVTTITDPQHTRYTFLRLKPPLTAYTFAVSAFDGAGNESRPSASVQATAPRRRHSGFGASATGQRR